MREACAPFIRRKMNMAFLVFTYCFIAFRAGRGVVIAVDKAEGAAFFEGVPFDDDSFSTAPASEMDGFPV